MNLNSFGNDMIVLGDDDEFHDFINIILHDRQLNIVDNDLIEIEKKIY